MKFSTWLLKQVKRGDQVGDLARDYKEDRRRRRTGLYDDRRFSAASRGPLPNTEIEWTEYLYGTDAASALRQAFGEWKYQEGR